MRGSRRIRLKDPIEALMASISALRGEISWRVLVCAASGRRTGDGESGDEGGSADEVDDDMFREYGETAMS